MANAVPTSENASGAPLAGRSVLVTRPLAQSRALAEPLLKLGAEVIAMPVIAIVDPPTWSLADAAIDSLPDYDWVVLTSVNAVDRFTARLRHRGLDPALALDGAGVGVAVVGTTTARRLEDVGIRADLVPEDFRAEGLADEFRRRYGAESTGDAPEHGSWRVLLPRALEAREVLPESLRAMGAEVDIAPVYRTVAAEADPAVIERIGRGDFDVVTFTSPSTVRHFAGALSMAGLDANEELGKLVKASIGPVSTRALVERGLDADIEADPSTAESLAEAIAAHFSASQQSPSA